MTNEPCCCPIPALCTRDSRGACFDQPAVHQHRVLKIDGSYYLMGVKGELNGVLTGKPSPGLFLLARYETGDCDRPYNAELMHSALYDAHQMYAWGKDGDRIETPHGLFVVRGVHVEPMHEAASDAKARRARLRRAASRIK